MNFDFEISRVCCSLLVFMSNQAFLHNTCYHGFAFLGDLLRSHNLEYSIISIFEIRCSYLVVVSIKEIENLHNKLTEVVFTSQKLGHLDIP